MSTAGLFQALDGLDIDTLPYVMVTTECFCGPTLAARADMDAGKTSLLHSGKAVQQKQLCSAQLANCTAAAAYCFVLLNLRLFFSGSICSCAACLMSGLASAATATGSLGF